MEFTNSDIIALSNAASRLSELCNTGSAAPIGLALRQPEICEGKADRLSVIQKDSTFGRQEDLVSEARQIKEAIKSKFRQQGEVARKEQLLQISLEIEALRSVICSLAAKAAIEAGQVSRSVREARGE